MSETSCLEERKTANDVRLTEEEVVTLFMNMIAFNGDWTAHLEFLNGLGKKHALKTSQIPIVREMQRRDMEFDLQKTIHAME
jgi:hypothetical protein